MGGCIAASTGAWAGFAGTLRSATSALNMIIQRPPQGPSSLIWIRELHNNSDPWQSLLAKLACLVTELVGPEIVVDRAVDGDVREQLLLDRSGSAAAVFLVLADPGFDLLGQAEGEPVALGGHPTV